MTTTYRTSSSISRRRRWACFPSDGRSSTAATSAASPLLPPSWSPTLSTTSKSAPRSLPITRGVGTLAPDHGPTETMTTVPGIPGASTTTND